MGPCNKLTFGETAPYLHLPWVRTLSYNYSMDSNTLITISLLASPASSLSRIIVAYVDFLPAEEPSRVYGKPLFSIFCPGIWRYRVDTIVNGFT